MVHVSINSVPQYVKSDKTLRIDKIWSVFVRRGSYLTLYYMVMF